MRKAGAATRTDCVLGAQFESSRPHHAVLRKRGFPGSVRIKIGGSSIWIRRRQAARPRDLRSGVKTGDKCFTNVGLRLRARTKRHGE
jgi:hypothetical protein